MYAVAAKRLPLRNVVGVYAGILENQIAAPRKIT